MSFHIFNVKVQTQIKICLLALATYMQMSITTTVFKMAEQHVAFTNQLPLKYFNTCLSFIEVCLSLLEHINLFHDMIAH